MRTGCGKHIDSRRNVLTLAAGKTAPIDKPFEIMPPQPFDKPEPNMQELEHWSIDRLIEYARNPRKNDHAVDRVAAAINTFGFRVPIIAKSDGTVVDGHLRLKAARKLGLDTVPVMLADDMTDIQIKAFRLSVNKMAELADWDDELLALELTELEELGFDLELTGFSIPEMTILMGFGVDMKPGTEDEQGRLDEISPIICPACGHEFHK